MAGFVLLAMVVGVALGQPHSGVNEVTEIDMTFFPGLIDEHKASVSFGEWHQFLEEERQEVEREEEEVISRLLEEERVLHLDEPIEFATQKRVMKQFSDMKKQARRPDYLSVATHHDRTSQVTAHDPAYDLAGMDDLAPPEIVLLEPGREPYAAYTLVRPAEKLPKEHQRRMKDLELIHVTPQIDAVPDATITRLLSDTPPPTSNTNEADANLSRHQRPHHHRHVPHRGPHNHQDRQHALFHKLLQNQRLIAPDDLRFLLGSDESKKSNVEEEQKEKKIEVRRKESLEDWEEDYEYDA